MSSTISTIAPVFISDKFTLNEQISHIRDLISSLSGVVFSSPIKTGKSDYYPALLEVFSCLGGIFRVREKAKLESVFYNLVTCCDSIPAPSRTEFFRALSEGFKTKSCKEDVVARLEYLELFFISFPDSDSGKYQLLKAYLELAVQHTSYSRISWISLSSLKSWCDQWGLKMEKGRYELFLLAKEAIRGAGRDKEALEILVDMNASFAPNNIKELAIELMCTALNKPDEFYLDKYSRLPTIKEERIINKPDLYQLFQIMLTLHYSDYKKFLETHPNTLTEFKLDSTVLERKIKLLTLVDLGAKSKIVTFEHISSSLDLSKIQVDGIVIEAMRHGLCQAKINEIDETVQFFHVPARIFDIDQWKYLHTRLEQFRNSLTNIPRDLKLS